MKKYVSESVMIFKQLFGDKCRYTLFFSLVIRLKQHRKKEKKGEMK